MQAMMDSSSYKSKFSSKNQKIVSWTITLLWKVALRPWITQKFKGKEMGQYFQRTEENYFELDFQTSYTINQSWLQRHF